MSYTTFITRILFSLLLGMGIGFERQLTGHAAGIRINALICMGTCFFTLFPVLYGSDQVFRVGSCIISGVGFLCSGVIFKDNGVVRGMNTAATLWCTSAIGILASTDKYLITLSAAAVLIMSNLILRPIAKKIKPIVNGDEYEESYKICVTCHENAELKIRKVLLNGNKCKTLFLNNLESKDITGENVEVTAEYDSIGRPNRHTVEELAGMTLKEPKVIKAGWEILS